MVQLQLMRCLTSQLLGKLWLFCCLFSQVIEIPGLKLSKKVKSMQMFHEPVESATQGDRLGICVTQFDPSLVERCIVSSPGYLQMIYGWQ